MHDNHKIIIQLVLDLSLTRDNEYWMSNHLVS